MIGTIRYKDKAWIETAQFLTRHSKCKRAQYAVVFLNKLGHIVGAGYNGKARGCDDSFCVREPGGLGGACCIHAEINGCSWTDPRGREGGVVFASGTPCDNCALSLLNSGVSRIVYLRDSSTCKTGHISNIVGEDFWNRNENGTEVVIFTFEEWEELYGRTESGNDGDGLCNREAGGTEDCSGQGCCQLRESQSDIDEADEGIYGLGGCDC